LALEEMTWRGSIVVALPNRKSAVAADDVLR